MPPPGTTLRSIRVADDLWDAAQARAEDEDTSVSEVIRGGLLAYVGHLMCTCGHHSHDHSADPSGCAGVPCGECACRDFEPAWPERRYTRTDVADYIGGALAKWRGRFPADPAAADRAALFDIASWFGVVSGSPASQVTAPATFAERGDAGTGVGEPI